MHHDSATMDQLRADLLRRAQDERRANSVDIEAGNNHSSIPEPRPERSPFVRFFTRRHDSSTTVPTDNATTTANENESIKSQDPNPRHSRILALPSFLTSWATRPNIENRHISESPAPLLPMSQASPMQSLSSPAAPEPVASSEASRQTRRSRRTRERPVDPLEVHLEEILGRSSARRSRHRSNRDRQRSTRRNGEPSRPRRFLLCFPWIQSRHVRAQIIRCLASGLFLIALITVYLVLTLSNKVHTSEMSIMLILIILFATVFFFHGLVRLYLVVIRKQREAAIRANRPPRYRGHARYAVPPHPIHVVLARDEEVVGMENEASKAEPPAYGLWRETVRVDPNRLFWQRNENADSAARPGTCASQRPPSYISEDGVAYVIEAAPRSTAPAEDVPLPIHPSEIGRVTRVPTN